MKANLLASPFFLQNPRLLSGFALMTEIMTTNRGITNAAWPQKLLLGFLAFHKMFVLEILKLR
jgi:hypothetical protein